MRLGAVSARGMNMLDRAGTCWGGEQESHWQEVQSQCVLGSCGDSRPRPPRLRPLAGQWEMCNVQCCSHAVTAAHCRARWFVFQT